MSIINSRDILWLDSDQPANSTVKCHRILRKKDDAHFPWSTAARAVTFHSYDTIHDIKSWFEIKIDVYKHFGKNY